MPAYRPLRLVVVSDDSYVQQSVSKIFEPPHALVSLSFENVSENVGDVVEGSAVQGADAVLVEWDPLHAPLIGTLAHRLRCDPVPIVALGSSAASEHAASLAVGADRYHPLPVSEFLLRAQIIAHRRGGSPPPAQPGPSRPEWAPDPRVELGSLTVDWYERRVRIAGSPIELTPRQFDVLAFFAARAGQLISRDTLLESVWGFHFDPNTNVVDVYVHHIRRILAARASGLIIETVRGRGYRLATQQV